METSKKSRLPKHAGAVKKAVLILLWAFILASGKNSLDEAKGLNRSGNKAGEKNVMITASAEKVKPRSRADNRGNFRTATFGLG